MAGILLTVTAAGTGSYAGFGGVYSSFGGRAYVGLGGTYVGFGGVYNGFGAGAYAGFGEGA